MRIPGWLGRLWVAGNAAGHTARYARRTTEPILGNAHTRKATGIWSLSATRLLRGKAMILAGLLSVAIAVVLVGVGVIGAVDWQIPLPVIIIAVAMFWWIWCMFAQKDIANQT